MKQNDTWIGSMLWGRVGASILMLAGVGLSAYGFEFSAEDQEAVYQMVSTLLGVAGAGMAVISKVREGRKK